MFSFEEKNHVMFYDLHRKTKKFDIYVIRNNINNKTFQDSKPCHECLKNIKKFGFKNIYYTLDDGKYIKMKVRDMESGHLSRSQKNIKIEGRKYLKI